MANPVQITAKDLADMVRHWLRTRPNGYLGQSYGCDIKSILQSPMSAGLADGLIQKCKADVPLARNANINIYAYDVALDKKVITFEVAGELITVGGA